MTEALDRRGLAYGTSAYVVWGLFPILMAALEPAGALEIVAWRALSSLLVCIVILAAVGAWRRLRAVADHRPTLLRLSAASVLIAINWGVMVYAVVTDRVASTSLGYYINPLLTVGLSVLLLGERLRRLQVAAIVLGGAAVVVIAVELGELPWISLVLAGSFALYSLIKKSVGDRVDALSGLTIETAVIAPVALGVLWVMGAQGNATVLARGEGLGWWHDIQMVGTGTWTAGALLVFAAGARRLPLAVTGMLQYIAPTMTFALAVWYFQEPMPPGRWIGFAIVWIALVLFSIDAWRVRPLSRRRAAGVARAAEQPVAEPL